MTAVDLSDVFDALANDHRRGIISALALQPHSINQLASQRGLTLPAIHKHIKELEAAEMVTRRKLGRTNYLTLNRQPLRDLQKWVNEFNPHWGSDKQSLENYAQHLGGMQPTGKDNR